MNNISEWCQGIHFQRYQLTSPLATKLQYYISYITIKWTVIQGLGIQDGRGNWVSKMGSHEIESKMSPSQLACLQLMNLHLHLPIFRYGFLRPPQSRQLHVSGAVLNSGLRATAQRVPSLKQGPNCFSSWTRCSVSGVFEAMAGQWSFAASGPATGRWRPVRVVFLQRGVARAISKKPPHWCPLSLGIGMTNVAPCWV